MIIQCDRCSTKFKIDDAKVTEEGVRVKCKKCQHIFVVKKARETFEELRIDEDLFLSEEGAKGEEEFPQMPQEKEEELSWTGALTTEEHPSQEPSLTSTTTEPGAPSKRRILVLALLLLLVLVGVGLALRGNLEQLNRGFSVLFETIRGKTLDKPPLGLIGLKGYYQANEKEGVLFVIEGRLVNPSKVIRSFTSIKGTIFDKDGKVFEEKTISVGKVLTQEQLSKLSRKDIEKGLAGGINALPPSKPSPFIVVFYQVPQDLSEFLVEVEE